MLRLKCNDGDGGGDDDGDEDASWSCSSYHVEHSVRPDSTQLLL